MPTWVLHHGFDLEELSLGGLEQLLALAGALGRHEWVPADDEALPGELLGLDLGQVALVEEGELEFTGSGQPLQLGRAERAYAAHLSLFQDLCVGLRSTCPGRPRRPPARSRSAQSPRRPRRAASAGLGCCPGRPPLPPADPRGSR